MKVWPLKNSILKNIPEKPSPGSFWEDRGDRYHCGIDLYAPEGSDVVAIEEGIVVDIGIATTPKKISYWNKTYYIIVKNISETFCKYAELSVITPKKGDNIKAGQLIGKIGLVLNFQKINKASPKYIQKLKNKNPSMLHLELYLNDPITSHENYLGGNWFGHKKPNNLVDPTTYMKSILTEVK